MLYEIHMIKNYPPTNLNRDNTGAPKTCMFGGVLRGRISSQCLKRSWRTSELFRRAIGESHLGIRTRQLPQLVVDELRARGVEEAYLAELLPKLSAFGNKKGEENKNGNYTAQMVFYAPEDIAAVADAVENKLAECATRKAVKAIKGKELQEMVTGADIRPVTLDIALFGRMVTSNAFADVEAAMQVAPAISTNKVMMESDYFTAMDDLLRGDTMEESGSGMIGDIDYDSSCYYLYASLDTDALRENLKHAEDPDELVRKAIPALLRTIAMTNPSGKQNSFAGHILPSAMLVECKQEKIPVSLVNAFAEPVRPDHKGDLVRNSIARLAQEVKQTSHDFGLPVEKRLWFCVDRYRNIALESDAVVCDTFADLVEQAEQALK